MKERNDRGALEDCLAEAFCDAESAVPSEGFSTRVMNSVRCASARQVEDAEAEVSGIIFRAGFAAALTAAILLFFGVDAGSEVLNYSIAAAELNPAEFMGAGSWMMF